MSIPQSVDYSVATRQRWAEHPYGGPSQGFFARPNDYEHRFPGGRAGARGDYQPLNNVEFENPYAGYGLATIPWNEGAFIIDLDQFLIDKMPIFDGKLPNTFCFGLLGCHGTDNNYAYMFGHTQGAILKIIGKFLSRSQDFLFNFLLGDNVYQFGVTDPRSPLFESCFYNVFKNVECFSILGNHDYNMHGAKASLMVTEAAHPFTTKSYRAMCQVYHSYIKRTELDPRFAADVNCWNMPFRYYALVSKHINTVFICVDSNTLIFDEVQQKWLVETYRRFQQPFDRQLISPNCILVAHHPLEYYGERAEKKDEWKKYVQDDRPQTENFPRVPQIFHFAANYDKQLLNLPEQTLNTVGHYLKYFLEQNNLQFKAQFAAHDHLLAYESVTMLYRKEDDQVKQAKLHVLTAGGGSADNDYPIAKSLARPTLARGWIFPKNKAAPYKYGYMKIKLNSASLTIEPYGITMQKRKKMVELAPTVINFAASAA